MPRIKRRRYITISDVKEIIKSLGEELDQFQRRVLDFAEKFSKIEPEKARELVDKLIEDFAITREEAVQIVNCMPRSVEELKTFFIESRSRITVIPHLEEMMKVIDQYRVRIT